MLQRNYILVVLVIIATKVQTNIGLVGAEKNITDVWLPRELGRFHLKDAAFVEVYEVTTPSLVSTENRTFNPDNYNLFITTFNARKFYKYSNQNKNTPKYYKFFIPRNI